MRIIKISAQCNQVKSSKSKSDIEYKIFFCNKNLRKKIGDWNYHKGKYYKNIKAYLNKKQIELNIKKKNLWAGRYSWIEAKRCKAFKKLNQNEGAKSSKICLIDKREGGSSSIQSYSFLEFSRTYFQNSHIHDQMNPSQKNMYLVTWNSGAQNINILKYQEKH